MSQPRLYPGLVIERLTLVAQDPKDRRKWFVRCVCTAERCVWASHLRNGCTTSCGCLRLENLRARSRIDGRRSHPLYHVWHGIKARCLSPTCKAYGDYGGRGITLAPEWVDDFMAFADHMGPRPSRQHSIDRIDNDGNYEPGNVRWATYKQQAANRRPPRERVCWPAQKRAKGRPCWPY